MSFFNASGSSFPSWSPGLPSLVYKRRDGWGGIHKSRKWHDDLVLEYQWYEEVAINNREETFEDDEEKISE